MMDTSEFNPVLKRFFEETQKQWDALTMKRVERLWNGARYSIHISVGDRIITRILEPVEFPGYRIVVRQKCGRLAEANLTYGRHTIHYGPYRFRRPEDFLQAADLIMKTRGIHHE